MIHYEQSFSREAVLFSEGPLSEVLKGRVYCITEYLQYINSPLPPHTPSDLIPSSISSLPDNPNPSQPVMTIKLNSKQDVEEINFPSKDGSAVVVKGTRNVLIETVFEMNYGNGQWRKLQLKRTFPVPSSSSTPNV